MIAHPSCVLSSAGSSHPFPIILAATFPQCLCPDTEHGLIWDCWVGCPTHLSSWCPQDCVQSSFCLLLEKNEADFTFHVSVMASHITS